MLSTKLLFIFSITICQINNLYAYDNTQDSISDYTLYFNDYTFDLSNQNDWDKITKTHSCTFPISSIQKRVCIHTKNNNNKNFAIKLKSLSSKSPHYSTKLNWNSITDWNEISHLLSPHSLSKSSAHMHSISNLLQNDYNYNYYDPDEDPFNDEFYETLTNENTDESYYTPPGFGRMSMSQMQQQLPPKPQPQPQYNSQQYSQQSGQQIPHFNPNNPMAKMTNQGLNPQFQQLLTHIDPTLPQPNPQLLQPNCPHCNHKELIELLKKDIALANHKHGMNINPMILGQQGMLQYMMQKNMNNNEQNMLNGEKSMGQKWMKQNHNEFKHMEHDMRHQDKTLKDLINSLRNKKGGRGSSTKDMVEMIKAMRNRNQKSISPKKKKVGSSYEKAYTDYLKKYKKYYNDWYKHYGTGANNQMGMGMGMGMPMGMGMGMPMGMQMPMGYGMGSMQPITHVHIHHASPPGSAHMGMDDVLDGSIGMEKCKAMQGVEICGRYGNKRENMIMTVRVGVHKRVGYDNAYTDYDDYYQYDSDDDFNGRRLVDMYYDDYDDYDDGFGNFDAEDMFDYSLWKAEKIFDDGLYNIGDYDGNMFDGYKHYLNRYHFAWDNDGVWDVKQHRNGKSIKCSKMIPALFTRICLHFDRFNKNIRLHFDTASVDEINDMLDDDGYYNQDDIDAVYNNLKDEYDVRLDWNNDKDWNEIKTIYNHAQRYYNNQKYSNMKEKCRNMFMASICVHGNLNGKKKRIGLKVNIANGKGILAQSKAMEGLNDYYQYLYDNVYDRGNEQQLMARQIAKERNILQDMDMV